MVKKKNRKYLSFTVNGDKCNVTLNFGDKSSEDQAKLLNKDGGLKLLSEIIGSKNNYFYENIESDALPLTTKLHDKGDQLFSYYTNSSDAPDNILAGSITKHSPDNGGPLPKNGYQGSLQIRNGNFYDVRYVESWEDDKTKPIYDSKANLNNGGIQHGLGLSMADRMSMEPTSYEKKKVVKKQHYKVKRADLMFHELCELFLRTDGGLYRGDDKSGAHHDSNQRAADAGFEPLNGNYSYGKKPK